MKWKNPQFVELIEPYIQHFKYQELKNYKHHGVPRYEHSIRVAYHTYKICKRWHLKVEEATIGALLHDFFTDEVKGERCWNRFTKHPHYAIENAKKYFTITPFEEDIIRTHMFPITLEAPHSLEGWIVDFVDDVTSVYERIYATVLFIIRGFRKK